jgi:hypothetical protein
MSSLPFCERMNGIKKDKETALDFNGADGGGRNIEIGFAYFRIDAEKHCK